MPRLAIAFFGSAVIYALMGMGLGMYMAVSQDHLLVPVHAHVNLLGWASLAIMGAFYGLAGDQAAGRLGWINLAVSNLGNLISLPLLIMLLNGNTSVLPVLGAGEALMILGMVLFAISIFTIGRRAPAAV